MFKDINSYKILSYERLLFFLLSVLVLSSCRNYNLTTNNNQVDNEKFYTDYSKKLGVKLDGTEKKEFIKEAYEWLGTPYLYGGKTKGKGTDCSGMIMLIYENVYGIKLYRDSYKMMNNVRFIRKDQLKPADIIFFKTNRDKVSHVGLYINDNKFIHASSSRGVIINDLNEKYYLEHYYKCGHVIKTEK